MDLAETPPAVPETDEEDCGVLLDLFKQAVQEAQDFERGEVDESEPYKLKYKAREKLQEAVVEFAKKGETANVFVARLQTRIGVNYYLTEENAAGESTLMAAVETLEGCTTWRALEEKVWATEEMRSLVPVILKDSGAVADLMNAYNYLGILWSHRALGNENAQRYLERSSTIFDQYMQNPATESDASGGEIEESHTNTLFFLAQVYTSQGKAKEGAALCAITLNRQKSLMHSYEPLRWAKDAIALSAYFGIGIGRTRQAAHFLSAASRTLETEKSKMEAVDEETRCLLADWNRARGALYSEILSMSCSLLRDDFDKVRDAWMVAEDQLFLDRSILLDDESDADNVPPSIQSILSFEAAREVFKVGNNCFEKAKEYYLLDGFATDHIKILQSQSQLFRNVSSFETDPKRFVAMHSRREKLLSSLLDELNPEYYAVQHQEISYELGEALRENLSSHLTRLGLSQSIDLAKAIATLSPADMKKVNECAVKVVKYYSYFIKAFEAAEEKDKKNGLETTSPNDSVPYLLSSFWIAHAFHKMVPTSRDSRILFLKESLTWFDRTLKRAKERIPPSSDLFQAELSICEDMVSLLPQQIDNIHFKGIMM